MNDYLITVNGTEKKVSIDYDDCIIIEDKKYCAEFTQLNNYSFLVKHKDKVYEVTVHKISKDDYFFTLDGYTFDVTAFPFLKKITSQLFKDSQKSSNEILVKSPMPGLIVKIMVEEGDEITKGTPLFCLEAMKMENVISSGTEGVIRNIYIETGMSVEKDKEVILIQK